MLDLSRPERFFLLTFLILGLLVASLSFYKKARPIKEVDTFSVDKRATLININTQGAEALEHLPGIGPVLALRILDYREKIGGFKDIEELKNIKGIGESKFEAIKGFVTISE